MNLKCEKWRKSLDQMLKLHNTRKLTFKVEKREMRLVGPLKKTEIIPQISYYFCLSGTSDKTQMKGEWNILQWKLRQRKSKRIAKTSQKL